MFKDFFFFRKCLLTTDSPRLPTAPSATIQNYSGTEKWDLRLNLKGAAVAVSLWPHGCDSDC